MKKKFYFAISLIFILIVSLLIFYPTQIALSQGVNTTTGIAVSEDGRTQWNFTKDCFYGDNMTYGVMASGVCAFDGTNYDRIRGDTTNGLDVDVTRMPASGGTNFYAIKRANIAGTSVNLAFGFTSSTVIVEVPGSNTDNIIVDWAGGTAVAPAANTAGDDILEPGRTVVLDYFYGTSISVIAASGTQTVYVRAFN